MEVDYNSIKFDFVTERQENRNWHIRVNSFCAITEPGLQAPGLVST